MIHPARKIPFAELANGLAAAQSAGMVSSKEADGRTIYIYTQRCVYDNGWDTFSLMARGLILDHAEQRIVATPFPKFFNAGERNGTIPDLPFEVFEKVDGSLAILHHHRSAWRAATKGAFASEQAIWVEAKLASHDLSLLDPGTTYLLEAVYPENRIVVHYHKAELVLLAAYREDGSEADYQQLEGIGDCVGWRVAKRHAYSSFSDLLEAASGLSANEEGFVIRFADGMRLKLKGDEYRRIHSLISRCTPLAMWEAMAAGDDLSAIRRDLPEEFWSDFDAITSILTLQVGDIKRKLAHTADALSGLSDKDVGLRLKTLDRDVQRLIFPWRKSGGNLDDRAIDVLYRSIRPTGNALTGYTPSYAMHCVADDAV